MKISISRCGFVFLFWTAAIRGMGAPNAVPGTASGELGKVVSRVMREGKDSTMNGGFARTLGLSQDGTSLPMKVVISESTGTTNRFWVSSRDTNTVVIGVREGNLGTFYLTDVSGRLKRAIVNDGNIREGGLTNIPVTQALKRFEEQKKWWVRTYGR
jgi:predicted protein tyrosine phosphatase